MTARQRVVLNDHTGPIGVPPWVDDRTVVIRIGTGRHRAEPEGSASASRFGLLLLAALLVCAALTAVAVVLS